MGETNSSRVLVVDDDVDLREALVALLEEAGYEVQAAANGREALRAIGRGGLPCLIVVDMEMPVMDGWAFLEKRSRDAALARVPVVVMTAGHGRAASGSLPVSVFLRKPFAATALLRVIARYCCAAHVGACTSRGGAAS